MVETYWNVGKQIYDAQGENQRAEYGAGLLKFLSEKLTEEFGKGYTIANIKIGASFYNTHNIIEKVEKTNFVSYYVSY